MPTTRLLIAALAALLAVSLAACGDDSDGDGAPEGGAPGGAEGGVFIEIANVGGFVPADFHFRAVPQAVVYADGTVIVPGAITLQFPGPPVLPLFTGQADDDALADLLDAAAAAGMIGNTPDVGDAGAIPIADAGSTRFTVVVDGDIQVVEAYALAEAGGPGSGPTNLSPAQVEARARLADLVAAVDRAALVADQPYQPERYRVQASSPPAAGDLDVAPNELAWPEGLPEPVEGRCVAITGDDVAAFEEALTAASEITRWSVGERVVTLAIRPVLPHEPDCPPAG